MIIPQRYVEAVPIADLIKLTDNARRGDLPMLKESMREIGFYGAVIVNEREGVETSGMILAGNHRVEGADENGEEALPVIYVDVDDKTARKIALADNHSTDRATYDVHDLIASIEHLDGDLDGTGYTEQDYADLLASVTAPDPEPYDDGPSDGDPDDSDFWPSVRVQLPPAVFAAWGGVCAQHDGDETAAFTWLIEQFAGEDLTGDDDIDAALADWD